MRTAKGGLLMEPRKRGKPVPRYALRASVRLSGVGYLEDAAKRLMEETNRTAEEIGSGLQLVAIGVPNG